MNADFAFVSSSNGTCQYPDNKSNAENHLWPLNDSSKVSMRGKGYTSLTVMALSFLKSMQKRVFPPGFGTSTTGLAQGLQDGLMMPSLSILAVWSSTTDRKGGGYLYGGREIGSAPGCTLTVCCTPCTLPWSSTTC
eukprot:GHVS01024499.1.p1 GENE.GHVS01024499.1~~GHVS01024499.1.p1  ORF type:complete len:136 (-),score=0.56 GHVS01024499.1:18-425(-)